MELASLIQVQSTTISESALHLDEIHHRAMNSLHLVNTLLLLQANVVEEETVRIQLKTAANRVFTIAHVHDRLYQDTDETYPKPSGTGLGMRLVRSYSGYGAQAVTVDRSAKTSTIHVQFKLP